MTGTPNVVVISSPREPVAVCVLSSFLLFTVVGTFFYGRVATNALQRFGELGGRTFLLLLAVGCSLYLVAAWIDTPQAVVRYERPGWLVLTAAFLIFGTWSVVASGARGAAFFLVTFALIVAAQWRLAKIRTLRQRLARRQAV